MYTSPHAQEAARDDERNPRSSSFPPRQYDWSQAYTPMRWPGQADDGGAVGRDPVETTLGGEARGGLTVVVGGSPEPIVNVGTGSLQPLRKKINTLQDNILGILILHALGICFFFGF